MQRWLVKTGNRKVNLPDSGGFILNQITDIQNPEDVIVLERVGGSLWRSHRCAGSADGI